MIVVERAVRPVRASVYHKRRMREELLEHLSAVFDDEMELQSDIQTGLERAKRRFGDPTSLTKELQQTVPWWDRVRSLISIMRLEPGESLLHFFVKCGISSIVFSAITLLWALPMLALRGGMDNIGVALHVVLVMTIFIAAFMFILISALTRIGLALHGDKRQRSKPVAARWMLAALFSFPALCLFFYVALSGDLVQAIAQCWLACCLSPIFTLLLLPMSRQAADELRDEIQWANLEDV